MRMQNLYADLENAFGGKSKGRRRDRFKVNVGAAERGGRVGPHQSVENAQPTSNMKISLPGAFSLIVASVDFPHPPGTPDFGRK